MKNTKIDKIVKICISWNKRKITAKEAMFQIYNINKDYILSKPVIEKSTRKCKWCGNLLPKNRISYCNMNHMRLSQSPEIKEVKS